LNKSKNELLQVSNDFIKEEKLIQTTKQGKKKGGPYSKNDRHQRLNEVYKLHFDYGFSARHIAEITKISRNTINGDINYWFDRIVKNWRGADPQTWVIKNINRLELQRTRIRTNDKPKTFQEQLAVEKLILEIDSKILQTQIKLVESRTSVAASTTGKVNNWLKKHGHKDRVLSILDLVLVSEKTHHRIIKIISEDKKRPV